MGDRMHKKLVKRTVVKIVHDPKYIIKKLTLYVLAKFDYRFARIWPSVDGVRGWLFKEEAYLLFKAVRVCTPGSSVIEIGSYEGRSTMALAQGAAKGVSIFAVDPHTGDKTQVESGQKIDTYSAFINNLKYFDSVFPIRKTSINAISDVSKQTQNMELLFIDGWHSEEAVSQDINTWVTLRSSHLTVIFDDWYQPEVRRGIIKNLGLLPPVVGNVGKDLVFSNDTRLTSSFLFKMISATTPRKILQTFKLK
jgi:hypothetical protein